MASKIKKKEKLSRGARFFLEMHENELRFLHERKSLPGRAIAGKRADLIDELIKNSLHRLKFTNLKGISIAALGGYGRGELCPYSDIDLLFLYSPKGRRAAKEVAEALLYLLWDLTLEVGHSVRTIDECMDIAKEDMTVLTSLLEGRLVFGDRDLFEKFDRKLFKHLLPEISSRYIERKIAESEARHKTYGRSVYILEPHVKEGEGSLRDIHSSFWIAKAKFKAKTFKELLEKGIILERELRLFEKALDFLLRIRTQLHYLANRREDRLTFEWQEKVAEFLGYRDIGEIKAVERFMRIYYLRGNAVEEYSKKLIERATIKPRSTFSVPKSVSIGNGFIIREGVLSLKERDIFKIHPETLVKAFELADRYGIEMSKYLTDLIRDSVRLIDDDFRENPKVGASFLRILKEGNSVSNILLEMNKLRVLGHYIPEFGRIVCKVQHDAYHVYTVDVHSIFIIGEIERLKKGEYEKEFPFLTRISKEILKPHVLYLAILFHDIGKGEGSNHSQRGAAMVPGIVERIGLSPEESETIEFLVKHHLVMPHFSQRRDIHDEGLIHRFARSVKALDTLKMLYLLSFGDIRSVGPKAWTNWKGMLLEELYLRTAAVLEEGEFRRESPEERFERVTSEVLEILPMEIPQEKVRGHLGAMPESYFLGFSSKTIAYHLRLFEEYGNSVGSDIVFHPDEGYDEFTFCGFDEPGLFSKLCGVLSANGINIMGARIVTRKDDRVLDVFYVNRLGKSTVEEGDELWDKVKLDMEGVLARKIDVEELVSKRKQYKPVYEKPIPKHPTRIDIDNETSDRATIIDVYTHDRVGLLYDITKTLTKLGLSIDYAKISTKVDQAADVFYVRDIIGGNKIYDPEGVEEIRTRLLEAIEEQ